jgi:hypothetical protein
MVREAPVELWAIVELMGHRRIAGRISEVHRYGVALCQVDEPRDDGSFRSSLYGGSSLYGIHIVSEHEAREAAKHASPRPFSWILDRAALPAAARDDFDDPSNDDDDDDEPAAPPTGTCAACAKPLVDAFVSVLIERDGEPLRELWHADCAETHARELSGGDLVDGVPNPVEGQS